MKVCTAVCYLSGCPGVLPLSRSLGLCCVVWIKPQTPRPAQERSSDGKPSGILTAEVTLSQSHSPAGLVFPLAGLFPHPVSPSPPTIQTLHWAISQPADRGEESNICRGKLSLSSTQAVVNVSAVAMFMRTSTSWRVASQASGHAEPHPSSQQLSYIQRLDNRGTPTQTWLFDLTLILQLQTTNENRQGQQSVGHFCTHQIIFNALLLCWIPNV